MAKKSALEDILGEVFDPALGSDLARPGPAMPLTKVIELELDCYLSQPIVSMNSSPFAWWEINTRLFPHLAKLAQRILVVQATSVSSERVFSTAGDIVTAKRSSLDPENVDKLIFLNKNYGLLPSNASLALK